MSQKKRELLERGGEREGEGGRGREGYREGLREGDIILYKQS